MDPETGFSCGYAPNRLSTDGNPFEDSRLKRVWGALEAVLRDLA
jgi:hypothetical protein